MNILKFIKSLLPSFKKEQVAEDARITLEELQNVVLPALQNATVFTKLTHKTSIELDDEFKATVKVKPGMNFITTLIAEFPKVIEFQLGLQEIIDKRFEKQIVIEGITVYKANVLQAQSLVSFVSRYTLELLNYIYILETESTGQVGNYVKDSITDGDVIDIRRDFISYCKALSCVTKTRKELTETLNDVPDVIIGSNPELTIGMYGDSSIDPMGMNAVSGSTKSPIFHIRMIIAEWQVNRYKKTDELKNVLELRVLNYQKQLDKAPDPKLEDMIQRTQSRIDVITNKMRKFEQGIGL